jgi:thiosulfate dehydrogenase
MMRKTIVAGITCAALLAVGLVVASERDAAKPADGTTVELCDGQTTVQLAANTPITAETGRKVADQLMEKWRQKNPGTDWIAEEQSKHKIVPPADNTRLIGKGKDDTGQGQTYGRISPEDVTIWARENIAMATRGSQVFHSGDELGSTIAVSCDMCHPDASNTHPETYPKFQPQLGRTVLLRDMINWCIEHPVRGAKLAEDDPKMRAMEAYILAQRKGAALDYGRR